MPKPLGSPFGKTLKLPKGADINSGWKPDWQWGPGQESPIIQAGEAPPITQQLVDKVQAERAARAAMDPRMQRDPGEVNQGIYYQTPEVSSIRPDNPAFVQPGSPVEVPPTKPNPRIMWAQESPSTDFEDVGGGVWLDNRTGRYFRVTEPTNIDTERM